MAQGYNARKVISEVIASFVLQCTVSLGGNVNTRWLSKPDMGSIIQIKNQWNILVRKLLICELSKLSKFSRLLTSSDTKRTLICIYSCLHIPPWENWFQCVRRIRNSSINFPCTITLTWPNLILSWSDKLSKAYGWCRAGILRTKHYRP